MNGKLTGTHSVTVTVKFVQQITPVRRPPASITQSFQHCAKKATIHRVTTMLATSVNVLFAGHNHLLTTSTDDPTL